MAYCIFRLYSPTGPADHHRRFNFVRAELVPKIEEIPGFQRYAAMICDDGRRGSFSVFDTKEAAERTASIAREWVQSRPEDLAPLTMELRGEIGLSIVVKETYESFYAVVRLYRTPASFEEVNEAIKLEAEDVIRKLPGMLRYTTAKLEDGRIGIFNAGETAEAMRAITEKARELRNKSGSRLNKVLPGDPEVITGKIVFGRLKQPPSAAAGRG